MKKMLCSRGVVFVLAVSLLATACSKAKDGTNGTNGTNGSNGAPGAPGSANVIYSAWTDVFYTTTDSITFTATIAAPKLADSIVQKGTVMVYVNANTLASPAVFALPYGADIIYYLTDFNIHLEADGPFSTQGTGAAKIQQYRYIMIPGGIAGRSAINWKDYQQVKQYLGLKD